MLINIFCELAEGHGAALYCHGNSDNHPIALAIALGLLGLDQC